jgi:hypothetical protein
MEVLPQLTVFNIACAGRVLCGIAFAMDDLHLRVSLPRRRRHGSQNTGFVTTRSRQALQNCEAKKFSRGGRRHGQETKERNAGVSNQMRSRENANAHQIAPGMAFQSVENAFWRDFLCLAQGELELCELFKLPHPLRQRLRNPRQMGKETLSRRHCGGES